MIANKKNINKLKELGFKKLNPRKYVFKDLIAYLPLEGEYIFFKYNGKDLPIINNIKSIKKIIEGIYEYIFVK